MSDKQFTSLSAWFPHYPVCALWPAAAVSSTLTPQFSEVASESGLPEREIAQITHPEMLVMRPAVSNGIGVLLIPGGSYQRVAIDKEGMDTAMVMSHKGYTVFVLTYRMPQDGHPEGVWASLADAQRAMRLIRSQAEQWPLIHLGVMGFSAGGHIAAMLTTRENFMAYPLVDRIDKLSACPDFAALIYPVITMEASIGHPGSRQRLLGEHPTPERAHAFSPEQLVTEKTPPCFLVHANDDPAVKAENSVVFWQALKAHHVPTELHLFEQGGHGFGIRDAQGMPAYIWPELCDNWLLNHFGE